MDQRSVTAPPGRANKSTESQKIGESQLLLDRRPKGISKKEHYEFSPTEEVAAGLSDLIQVFINQSHLVDGDATPCDNSRSHHGYSTSSYDGVERTPDTSSSGTSRDLVVKPSSEAGDFYGIRSSSSFVVSSPEANVRIKTVPHHSVTKPIVRSDSPIPAHYLHSSNPTNIDRQFTGNYSEKPGLGRAIRFRAVTVSRKPLPGHYTMSSASGVVRNNEAVHDRVDPDKIRDQVLSRRPSTPIPIIDFTPSVLYHSSGSSRGSQLQTPDLFPKPLILDKQPQENPPTPANTVVTPRPLISITPPTPLIASSILRSPDTAHTGNEMPAGSYRTITVLAHTGASTPGESMIDQVGEPGIGNPTAGKGTMASFEYGEDANKGVDRDLRPPPEIPTPVNPPGHDPNNLPVEQNIQSYLNSEKTWAKITDDHAQENLDELVSYSDFDQTFPTRKHVARTLYEEYPRHNGSKKGKPTSKSQSRRTSASRGRKAAPTDKTRLPMSTGSFARIINELEDMLDQDLNPAGRAVIDSHTALGQRDPSIRSVRSLRESVLSNGESIFGNAIAESFRIANDQQAAEDITDERKMLPTFNVLRKKLTGDSTLAVYRDDGGATSDAGDDGNTKPQRRGRTTYSESDRRPQSAPTERRANEIDLEQPRSKIPRPARNSTLNSFRSSNADRFNGQREPQTQPVVTRQKRTIRIHQPPLGRIQLIKIPIKKGGWDWSLGKKIYAAGVSCAVVVLMGFIIGCYDGETPAIKASLGITTSLTPMGNVLFILGVAMPSLLFWPLSLLHGRKPYTLLAIALTIALQIPQALSLPPHTIPSQERSMIPFIVCILVFRAVSGLVLGFATMNALATLVDLFGPDTGACCRGGVVFNSSVPIEGQGQSYLVPGGEAGARMGIWLGAWAWLFFAFGGVGFLIGRLIMTRSSPAWGFWIVAIVAAVLLFLTWLMPEVRPPRKKQKLLSSRRTGWKGEEKLREDRGEIKMVISGTSPNWWWEEVWVGVVLSFRMCRQLGFLVMDVYVGWVAGEVATVFNLLTELEYVYYGFSAVDAGPAIFGLSVGALLSVPVQLSTFYLSNFRHRVHHRGHSEARHHYHGGQHPYRTALFISVFLVPAASLGFTISATGPPVHFIVPAFFAGLIAFSGTLAIAECHLIIMENFDISSLPEPLLSSGSGSTSHGISDGGRLHGTQRPSSLVGSNGDFITCHPAITAAFGILQFMSLTAIAGAIGRSRIIANGIGVKYGLGIFTVITFLMTIALVGVLWRWKEVMVLELYADQDSEGQHGEPEARVTEEIRVCKISILQKGLFTRWSEVNGMVYRGDEEEEDAWRVRGAR